MPTTDETAAAGLRGAEPAARPARGPGRDSRLMSGREVVMRDRLARREILTQSRGRLYVNPEFIPAGVRYKWVRAATLGQPDNDNVLEALEMGWKPVPPDRHPELVPPNFMGLDRPVDHIAKGGQILMERPEEICAEDEEILRGINLQILREVDSGRAREQARRTPTMPPLREMSHRTIVGREPDVLPGNLGGHVGEEAGGTFEE